MGLIILGIIGLVASVATGTAGLVMQDKAQKDGVKRAEKQAANQKKQAIKQARAQLNSMSTGATDRLLANQSKEALKVNKKEKEGGRVHVEQQRFEVADRNSRSLGKPAVAARA